MKYKRQQDKKYPQIIDNRYGVIKLLGRGGMGAVYKVKDLLNNKILALKMLTEEASKSTAIMRFKNEFYYLTQLKHPNLCAVYDFGVTEKENYYFTMDYVSGKNLKDAVKGLSYDEIYFLLVQVLRTLQYIHSKGIIHYDIKPSNILVESKAKSQMSNAKLMDFGLAGEVVSGSTGLIIRGTLNYIAPEMIKGVGVDVRADLYSFGVLLYELFTGQLPFKGDTSVVLLKEHLEKIPEAPRNLNPEIPDGLQRIILKLLEKDPGDRFFSANEVIEAINEFSKEKFALQTKATKESYILSGKFVGREKELERLKSIYHNLSVSLSPGLRVSPSPHLPVSPSPHLILITGESGIGKTRLLQEFRYYVQLERGRFFLGHCYSDVNVAYQP
ncbi:MAG: serine/threonine-protein kinase, partial [candidate division WOR-3 bacterium]